MSSWLGVVQTVLPTLLSMTVAVGCEDDDDDDVLGSCLCCNLVVSRPLENMWRKELA